MSNLKTPFGDIIIKIDNHNVEYTAIKGNKNDDLFPNILGRYKIIIDFIPDGKKHTISCVFETTENFKSAIESGENLECQGFYNESRIKLSIGVEGELVDKPICYDYSVDYLANGMSYLILEETKTQKYIFGIAWIDNVGWDDPILFDGEKDRAVETWFASDPNVF